MKFAISVFTVVLLTMSVPQSAAAGFCPPECRTDASVSEPPVITPRPGPVRIRPRYYKSRYHHHSYAR